MFEMEVAINLGSKRIKRMLGEAISEGLEEGRNQRWDRGVTYSEATESYKQNGILKSVTSTCTVGGVLVQHNYVNSQGNATLTTCLSHPHPEQVDEVQKLMMDNLVARYQRFYGKTPEVAEPEVVL